MRDRLNLSLPVEMIGRINDLAVTRKMTRSAIVEQAVASYLSPDGSEKMEAAFSRRMDRMHRQVQRLERDQTIALETLSLFIWFWLGVMPVVPPEARDETQARRKERYTHFVASVARRLEGGRLFRDEIPLDIPGAMKPASDDQPDKSG